MFLLARNRARSALVLGLFWAQVQIASAASCGFQKQGPALIGMLGTPKVSVKKVAQDQGATSEVYYAKGPNGKASKVAVVEKGMWEPGCSHTWAIGIDPGTGKVTEIKQIEMSCPHAHEICVSWFQDQFIGKGVAEMSKLEGSVKTVAKATGSSKIEATAVRRAVNAFQKLRGQI